MTIYYVDATTGNDSDDGLSEANAWATLNKVNISTFNPGDFIKFKCGEKWRERLIPPSSGSSGSPITFTSYGSGPFPQFLGSTDKSSTGAWTNESGNLWYSPNATHDVENLIFDNETSYSTLMATKGELVSQGQIWWDNPNHRVYLYSVGNPATFYNGWIEAAQYWTGGTYQGIISINSKSYITIENIDLRYVASFGIKCVDSSHIIVDDCTIKYCGSTATSYSGFGFCVNNTTVGFTDYIVRYCNISYCNRATEIIAPNNAQIVTNIHHNTVTNCVLGTIGAGISFGAPGTTEVIDYTGSIVHNNTISLFKTNGVQLSHASHMVVEYNIIHDSTGTNPADPRQGIGLGTYGMHSNIVRYNHIYNIIGVDESEWDDGIGVYTRACKDAEIYYNVIHDVTKGIYSARKTVAGDNDNPKVYNNVCYNVGKYGIWIQGVDAGASLKTAYVQNNITYTNGGATDYGIILETDSAYDDLTVYGGYNCLMDDSSVYKGPGVTYNGSGNDLYNTNPLFVNGGGSYQLDTDFILQDSSPCINVGVDIDLTQDYFGSFVGSSPDIGIYEKATIGELVGSSSGLATVSGVLSGSGGTTIYELNAGGATCYLDLSGNVYIYGLNISEGIIDGILYGKVIFSGMVDSINLLFPYLWNLAKNNLVAIGITDVSGELKIYLNLNGNTFEGTSIPGTVIGLGYLIGLVNGETIVSMKILGQVLANEVPSGESVFTGLVLETINGEVELTVQDGPFEY